MTKNEGEEYTWNPDNHPVFEDSKRSGVIVIDKPLGMTSHDVVYRIRRLYGTKSVGHTGTLDPDASGVLPVMVGRAVKAAEFLLSEDKEYLATLTLGLTTDTLDASGSVLSRSEAIPASSEVLSAASSFIGEYLQTPPMYSALKYNGKKLADLARRGVEVERTPRPVRIYELHCEQLSERDYSLGVACSKGTYIRSLCDDIGRTLGCGGIMSSLRRLRSGAFTLENAHTLEALEGISLEQRYELLCPTDRLFASLREIKLAPFFEYLARNGNSLYLSKLNQSVEPDELVRLSGSSGFFALARSDGELLKPVKQF